MFMGGRVLLATKVTQMRVFLKGTQRLQELGCSSCGGTGQDMQRVTEGGRVKVGCPRKRRLLDYCPLHSLFIFCVPLKFLS